jgi:hypothetical protein
VLALHLNVSLIHLGCETAVLHGDGVAVGLADKFNSVEMVHRLARGIDADTVAGFMEALASPDVRVVFDFTEHNMSSRILRMSLVEERKRPDRNQHCGRRLLQRLVRRSALRSRLKLRFLSFLRAQPGSENKSPTEIRDQCDALKKTE